MPVEVTKVEVRYTMDDIKSKCNLTVEQVIELAECIWPKSNIPREESDTFTAKQLAVIQNIHKMSLWWSHKYVGPEVVNITL